MKRMIAFYNLEATRFWDACVGLSKKQCDEKIDSFIDTDASRISWTRGLKQELTRNRRFSFDENCMTTSLYRPFIKQWLYFNRTFNEMVLQMPRIFPGMGFENRVICVSGVGARSGFSSLIADAIPCLDTIEKGQCYPLYLYEDSTERSIAPEAQTGLFGVDGDASPKRKRRDAITDEGLEHFHVNYQTEKIGKHDVFYYIYGLLHSPDYRQLYADNLSKELPRIPCVKSAADFWAFSKAGSDLAELHLNYETVAMYPAKIDSGGQPLTEFDYRVEKMRHGKNGKDKDLSTVHYNSRITVKGIPVQAYDYVVNGKPAIEWVMERQCVKTDKDSGIVNDANDWAIETMKNPRYPLELLLRVVTVSLETMKIVNALPKLAL